MLELSQNAICPSGCVELAPLLREMHSLEHLYLNHVALSEAGGFTISDALLESKARLITLHASKNRMGPSAGRLAKVI